MWQSPFRWAAKYDICAKAMGYGPWAMSFKGVACGDELCCNRRLAAKGGERAMRAIKNAAQRTG